MRRSLGARNPVPFHRQASAPPCDRATDAGPTPIVGMAHWHDPAANGRSQTDGSQLMEQHRDLGLNLEPAAKLAAQARPRSGWESLQADAQEQLDEILRQSPGSTRSTAEYRPLLEETAIHDETDEDDDTSA